MLAEIMYKISSRCERYSADVRISDLRGVRFSVYRVDWRNCAGADVTVLRAWCRSQIRGGLGVPAC